MYSKNKGLGNKLHGSFKKIIISVIFVAAISGGIITLIFNTTPQNQIDSIEQINHSDIIAPITEQTKLQNKESDIMSKFDSKQTPTPLKAAIIDQLHEELPNFELQANATKILEEAGYQVDLYLTDEITVDFYKNLPSMNYHFILIRSHGGEDLSYEYPTRLFTGEKFSKGKYTGEQIYRQVGYGFPLYEEDLEELKESEQDIFDKAYFTVGTKMVEDVMVGTFPDSIIIVGGCQSARSHDLMEALMKRGAKHVLGWGATISSKDNDKAMISLLEDIFVNDVSLYDAVAKVNKELRPDFEHQPQLKLFNKI